MLSVLGLLICMGIVFEKGNSSATGCGYGHFSGPSGQISSPNFPLHYANNLDCYNNISVFPGHTAIITFLEFHTEAQRDYVTITCESGNAFRSPRYSGRHFPTVLAISSCNILKVLFHTDSYATETGFSLTYNITSDNVTGGITTRPLNASLRLETNRIILNCTSASDYFPWWTWAADNSTITNSACSVITSVPHSSWFLAESLGPGSCNLIMVEADDYPYRLVGSLVCTDLTLSSATAIIPPIDCGIKNFSEPTGIISSPNFPLRYADNLYCYNYITAPLGQTIVIAFLSFNTGYEDYVAITCESGSAFRSPHYSGGHFPTVLAISSCNLLKVLFHTDTCSYGTETGFSLTYNITSENVMGGLTTKPSNALLRSDKDDRVIFNCTTASKYLPWWTSSRDPSRHSTITNSTCGLIYGSSSFRTESLGPGSCNLIVIALANTFRRLAGSFVCTDSTLSSAIAILIEINPRMKLTSFVNSSTPVEDSIGDEDTIISCNPSFPDYGYDSSSVVFTYSLYSGGTFAHMSILRTYWTLEGNVVNSIDTSFTSSYVRVKAPKDGVIPLYTCNIVCEFLSNISDITDNSYAAFDISFNTESVQVSSCEIRNFSGPTGRISLDNFQMEYDDCYNYITVPSGKSLFIKFLTFNMREYTDSVTIICESGNAFRPSSYSGRDTFIPAMLTISSCNLINVYFYAGGYRGADFSLTYNITSDNVIGGIITKPSNAFRRSYNDDPVIFNCTTASKYLPWWKFSDETSHSDTVTNSACGIIISSRYGSWFMTESVGPGSCNLIMVPSGDYPLVGSLVCTDSTLSSATAIVVQTNWPTEDNITITGQNKTPAVLHCNVVANRSVTYVWMDETNGRIITRGPTIIANHGGNYTCIASTIINRRYFCQAKSVNVLEVPVFPTVTDAPHDVNVTEGESFTFKCNPSGNPFTRIVWLRDGKELDPGNPPKRFVFSSDMKSLTIRDVCRVCVDRERRTDLMFIQCNASNDHGYAFASGYLHILSKHTDKFCNNDLDKEQSIHWNRTLSGKKIHQPCPGNTTGLLSRKCLLNSNGIAVWSKTNFNGCFEKEFRDLLTRVNELKATALENQTVVAQIVNQLSESTNKSEGLNAGNLNASVMMLNQLAVLRRNNTNKPSKREIESFIQATSNVLQPNNFKAWKELQDINRTVATALLFSVEVYGRSLATLNIANHSTEDADNLVLEAWSLHKSNLPLQLEFPSRSIWRETRGDTIFIFMKAMENSILSENHSTLNIWGSYYRTVNDYLPGNKDVDVINSRVISFSIDGLKTKDKLYRPVIITLQHNQAESTRFGRKCAFWKFDSGEWDSSGCSVTSTNLTHTICSCDHLTNFAILMSRTPSYDKSLSIISIIGCSMSVVGLVLTIIIYAYTWKQSKSAQATVLLNLCVALTIAYIIFIAGADKVDYQGGCKAVAVLLHYFFLAAFFIMLAEGIELVLYIVFVFHVRRTRETVLLVVSAWVIPLIIVAVSLGSTKGEGYSNQQACWLTVHSGLIWAFLAPVLCIITANFVILTIVLVWRLKKKSILANNPKKSDEIRATLWNLSVTCPVLGLGWLFGVFSVVFSSVVFQYLFVIANSLQGVLIFVFHGLFHNKKMNEQLSNFVSNYICRCRRPNLDVSTQMTSTLHTKKSEKSGFAPMEMHGGLGKKDNVYSAGTQFSSIEESDTMESTNF